MSQGRVLIVEDDPDVAEALSASLQTLSLDVTAAKSVSDAVKLVTSERFDVILSDLVMPEGGGKAVIRFVQEHSLHVPVIIISAYGTIDVAEAVLADGAFDFIAKPVDIQSLAAVLRRALVRSGLIFDETVVRTRNDQVPQFPYLIGNSQAMNGVLRRIAKVAEVDSNVIVYGESGTGKELVARAVHYSSKRAQHPLVVFDCTAVPEGLMESEMFGHVKGSFTSALYDREGVFQLADGGSLFMDEIGELGLPLQAKLLRVIQSREFRRIGAKNPTRVDVRIIAATNRDLRAMVADGRFREDLYYRLEVVPITVPPLRDRKEDIPLLVDHFIQRFNRNNTKEVSGVSSHTMSALLRYNWPGNIRELENCIERAAVMVDGKQIDLDDLSQTLRSNATEMSNGSQGFAQDLKESRKEAERATILKALQSVNGNRTRAAELLGVSLRTLHYRLKEILKDNPEGV